jgi:hypothetical protein
MRIAGNERSWLLFKISNKVTNHLASLLVKGVPPDSQFHCPPNTIGLVYSPLIRLVMYDFEELLMHSLNVIQAREMLRRSISTMLAHVSYVETQSPKANLLDIIRYLDSRPVLTLQD